MTATHLKSGTSWQAWLRWGGAAVIVLTAHAAAGAWIIAQNVQKSSLGEGAEAVMIELAPPSVSASGEEVLKPAPEPKPEPETSPPEEIAMPPLPEPAEPVLDLAELQPPPPSPAPEPEVVLPAPKPPVKEPEKKPEVKKQPVERKPKPQTTKKERRPETKQAAAPASQTAAASSTMTSATGSVARSSSSVATWQGLVQARVNQAARSRPLRERGIVKLDFRIDRGGRVVSATIVGSSGSGTLDQEALALVRRVSQVPAPPPEMQGAQISLILPVRFKPN